MKELISKELLWEVLGYRKPILYDTHLIIEHSYLVEVEDDTNSSEAMINIHELAHKCKIKALECGYILQINPQSIVVRQQLDLLYFKMDIYNESGNAYDPIDIIRACQWILKNKG